jgi:hypothetical protein
LAIRVKKISSAYRIRSIARVGQADRSGAEIANHMTGIESRLQAMMATAASRQEVLKQIWITQGPDALFRILEN